MSPALRKLVATGLVAFCCASVGAGAPVSADTSSVAITINSAEIAQQIDPGDGLTHDFVRLSGTISNSGNLPINDSLQLVTGSPIGTRSELAAVIDSHVASGINAASVEPLAINDLEAGVDQQWTFNARADQLWGTRNSGVFPIGVSTSSGLNQNIVAISWFGNDNELSPTHVTTAVLLTSNKYISDENDAQAILSSETSRLSALTSVELSEQSFIVDNYALDLLATANSDIAKETATRISVLQSASSVYGSSNLARLNAGKQRAAIKRALALTPNTGNVLYLANDPATSLTSFGKQLDSVVIPVVTNSAVKGDKYATVDARAHTQTQKALVADRGLSDCLLLKSAFETQWCLSTQLGMITAESPNVSRNVLIVTPQNWSPNAATREAVANALRSTFAYKNESLVSLLRSNAVTSIELNGERAKPFDSSVRKTERDVLRAQKSVENVFGETSVSKALASISVVMYSQNWKSATKAKHFGRTHVQQAHALLNQLRLEGSKHITIPGTKADLPITVFNSSPFAAKVQVIVSGAGANRITAKPSELVTVEPGSRVTLQIPIALNSAGDVQAVAYLADSTGDTFGDSLSIQIASTAYQQFARSLVWVALTALILLVGNNVWRRTRSKPNQEDA